MELWCLVIIAALCGSLLVSLLRRHIASARSSPSGFSARRLALHIGTLVAIAGGAYYWLFGNAGPLWDHQVVNRSTVLFLALAVPTVVLFRHVADSNKFEGILALAALVVAPWLLAPYVHSLEYGAIRSDLKRWYGEHGDATHEGPVLISHVEWVSSSQALIHTDQPRGTYWLTLPLDRSYVRVGSPSEPKDEVVYLRWNDKNEVQSMRPYKIAPPSVASGH